MPESLVVRWGNYVTHALERIEDPRRFCWTLSVRIQMEHILRPMFAGAFSGYLGRSTESDALDTVIAKIRQDLMPLSEIQKELALESFVLYLVERARNLHPRHRIPLRGA